MRLCRLRQHFFWQCDQYNKPQVLRCAGLSCLWLSDYWHFCICIVCEIMRFNCNMHTKLQTVRADCWNRTKVQHCRHSTLTRAIYWAEQYHKTDVEDIQTQMMENAHVSSNNNLHETNSSVLLSVPDLPARGCALLTLAEACVISAVGIGNWLVINILCAMAPKCWVCRLNLYIFLTGEWLCNRWHRKPIIVWFSF